MEALALDVDALFEPVLSAPHLAPSSLADLGAPHHQSPSRQRWLPSFEAHPVSNISCSFSSIHQQLAHGPSASHTSRTSPSGTCSRFAPHLPYTETKLSARVGHRLFLPSFLTVAPSGNYNPPFRWHSRFPRPSPPTITASLSSPIRIQRLRHPHHIHCIVLALPSCHGPRYNRRTPPSHQVPRPTPTPTQTAGTLPYPGPRFHRVALGIVAAARFVFWQQLSVDVGLFLPAPPDRQDGGRRSERADMEIHPVSTSFLVAFSHI